MLGHRPAGALLPLGDRPLAGRPAARAARPVGGAAVAFVGVLALGLARLARTATTQKVCTVYLVDVSDSIPDAALDDARAEVQRGRRRAPAATTSCAWSPSPSGRAWSRSATRPRRWPAGGRRWSCRRSSATGPASGPRPTSPARCSSPTACTRRGTCAARSSCPTACRPTATCSPRRTARKLYGVKLFAVPYKRPVPGEVAVRELRVPDKVREGETFDVHAQVFSSRAADGEARRSSRAT